jgi:hypothetical protein
MKRVRRQFIFSMLCLAVGLVVFGIPHSLLAQEAGEIDLGTIPEAFGDLLPDQVVGPRGVIPHLAIVLNVGTVQDLEDLLDSGIDPDALIVLDEEENVQTTALIMAVSAVEVTPNAYHKVRALLDAGADVHLFEPSTGNTALHWAAINGPGSIMTLLLEAGGDANLRNERGETAYELALRFANRAAVEAIELHVDYRHPLRDELYRAGIETKGRGED